MFKFLGYIYRRLYFTLFNFIYKLFFQKVYESSVIKKVIISSLIQNYKVDTFVESGTYLGNTSIYVSNFVKKVFTIEIDKMLFNLAKFRLRKYSNISVIEGDSGNTIQLLLAEIDSTCLFFLDGHYSGGISSSSQKYLSPLDQELTAILSFKMLSGSIIVIDDARELGKSEGYPSKAEIDEKFKLFDYTKIELCDLFILIFE